MSLEDPRDVLRREALRLHRRYLTEVVEQFSVCPWAKSARAGERMRTHGVTEAACKSEELRSLLDDWAHDKSVEVAFVITPRFEGDREAFTKWAARVAAIRDDVFLSAPFHPDPRESSGTIPFLRRTPDPTLQLVRRSSLEDIRAQDPPHYQDIFSIDLHELQRTTPAKTVAASVLAHNERLLAQHRERLESILEAIHQDRHDTYGDTQPP